MKTKTSLRRFILSCAGLAMTLGGTYAFADNYPSKPIKAIVPFAAGSATDQIGRALQPKWRNHWVSRL